MSNRQNKLRVLTRRDFVRNTIGSALGVSLLGAKRLRGEEKKLPSSLVTIIRNKNVMNDGFSIDINILKKMLDQTVIEFTGKKDINNAWLTLVKPKDTVGLVTTQHLNPTHKELVDAVKSSLIRAGIPGNKIVMAQGSPEKARICTALISMPALKAHWLTGIGTVLKHYIMFSGRPNRYHYEDSSKLGEIWNLPHLKGKTKLIIVDALYPLCDKGPQPDPRYKWTYKGLIAGTDPVAVETVCLKIITKKREVLRGEPWPLSPPALCVEAADKIYRLGTSHIDRINIKHYGWEENLLL